jgi:hypothetical protein
MSCGSIGIPLWLLFDMIFSENRIPLFRIMLQLFSGAWSLRL